MPLNWIELSRDALLKNLSLIKKKAHGKKILAVVKSNAYGHGLTQIAEILKNEVQAFIVGDLEEGLELNSHLKDCKIILSLPPTAEEEIIEAAEKEFSIFIGNLEHLKIISTIKIEKPLRIHLEINTGMNRSGLEPEELEKALDFIQESKNLILEGIFSHYATLPQNLKFAKRQAERFSKALDKIKHKEKLLIHMENSSGILKLPLPETNSVRPGISLYGLAKINSSEEDKFVPVLTLRSTIIDIMKIKKGEGVSYDHIYKAKKDMYVATIPFGYGNGYMWNLKGKGEVIVKGIRLPIVGKICMNHIIFDATPVINQIKIGDHVTLIGRDCNEEITVNELAEKSGTINYEIVSKLSSKITRFVI